MANFNDELKLKMESILNEPWDERAGQTIPSTSDVAQKNGAVRIEATFLYADLAGSTDLQKNYKDTFAAKAIRMYLAGAASIIRKKGGVIKSFDGDRVMGVFIGKRKRNDAVLAAFAIEGLVRNVINPMVRERHVKNNTNVWVANHGVGIDSGEVLITRAGVRNKAGQTNHNDLVFVGRAPNVAAKLSALRGASAGPIVVTHAVYNYLDTAQRTRLDGQSGVWSGPSAETVGPYEINLYRSSYWRNL